MPSSSFIYDLAQAGWANGALCLWSSVTASYYVTLLTPSYVPNGAHSYASNFSGSEVAGGFSAGYNGSIRISLTGRTLVSNTVSHQAEFGASQVSWVSLTATVAAWCVVQQAGSDGLSPLICYNSLGGFPLTMSGATLVLSFANSGLFLLQQA